MQGKIHESMRVARFSEASPGVWYPLNATRIKPRIDPTRPPGLERHTYSAKKVIANDPSFDPKIFKIEKPFPMAMTVARYPEVDVNTFPPTKPDAKGKEEQSKRAKSAEILKNIGGLVGIYANDFHGAYPPDLATAAKVELSGNEYLKSPMGDEKVGYAYFYLYYTGMKRPIPNDQVIAYDASDAAKNGGASVLFGDGNVRWLDAVKLKAALGRTEAVRPRS